LGWTNISLRTIVRIIRMRTQINMLNKTIKIILTVITLTIAMLTTMLNAFAGGTVVTLSGKCMSFMAMDISADASFCKNIIINMEMTNGRNGFLFFLDKPSEESVVVSFFGDGTMQVLGDKNHATQPIDRVRFTYQGNTDDLKAVGVCSFANPYMKKPVIVECKASTSRGNFKGRFITNGTNPDTFDKP
jgi:hypothetical protein